MASKTGASLTSNSKSQPRTCLCSPTKHPGSFRCSRHRNPSKPAGASGRRTRMVRVSSNNWELSLITKADSISIKTLLIKMIKIKPSSHDLQRRRSFQPKPSRFCILNGNGNGLGLAVS